MSLARTSRPMQRAADRRRDKEQRQLANKLKALKLSNFDYRADDKNQTLSAAGPALVDFLNVVGLGDFFKQHVEIDKRASDYSPHALFRLLILQNILGIDRIENSRVLNQDKVLLKKLGLERYPDPQTLRDELARYDQAGLNGLALINRDILGVLTRLTAAQEVDLHFDAKIITVYGDQEKAEVGYNPHKHGRKCYHLKICTLEPFGVIVAIELQSGNAVSNTGFVEFYEKCVTAVPQSHFPIRTVRLDSGFFGDDTISAFEGDFLFFEVAAKKSPSLKQWIAEYVPDSDFKAFNAADTIEGAGFQYGCAKWDKPRDFVVVRKLQKSGPDSQTELLPKWQYQVICHNQPDFTPQQVWEDYNRRARCELNIRDLDYDHFVTCVPTGGFSSNFAYFWMCTLSFNLMVIFRRFALPVEWAKARTSTLRKKLINIPGRLVSHGGKPTMRLMEAFPFVEAFNYVKERLRWLFGKLNPAPA